MSVNSVQNGTASKASTSASDFATSRDRAVTGRSAAAGRASYAQEVQNFANLARRNPKAFWRKAVTYMRDVQYQLRVPRERMIDIPIYKWRTMLSVVIREHLRHPERIKLKGPELIPFSTMLRNINNAIDNLDNKFQAGIRNNWIPAHGIDGGAAKSLNSHINQAIGRIQAAWARIPGR